MRSDRPTAPDTPAVIDARGGELAVGQVLAGRYEVGARLGRGGMGTVWRAHDRSLNEDLAVKVLHDGSGDAGALDRFCLELKLARKISHPNVCRVHDLGESDGLRFLTMALVEGPTLRGLLTEGALAPPQALALLRQVASGLAACHAQGVIHRDVKPENVVVDPGGHAVLVDFGIARSTAADATITAAVVGTPAYMSPEQLRGEPLDARSDVFSLGALGFEMLMGRSPFGEGTTATITSAILNDPSPRLEVPRLPAGAGQALDALLARALAKRREERLDSAARFGAELDDVIAGLLAPPEPGPPASPPVAALQRPREPAPRVSSRGCAVVLVAALLVGLVAFALRARWPVATPRDQAVPAAIVVIPFDNLTGDVSWDALGQGASEAVLAGLRTLARPGAGSAPRSADPVADARQSGAAWVLAGSVQRVGPALRLAAQIRATDGSAAGEPIEVDGDPGDVPRLLAALRRRSVDEARLVWRDHERRERAVRGTGDEAARARLLQYEAMVRAAPRPQHYDEGKRLLDEALAADAAYVPALVERARLQSASAGARRDPSLHAAALADLDRALARAPGDAEALVVRCRVLQVTLQAEAHFTDAELASAFAGCNAARHADPASPEVLLVLAHLYEDTCQNGLAIDALEQALELDRGASGQILAALVRLALQDDRVQVADRTSQRLVEFEDEQRALGPRGIAVRTGTPPARGAHLLRGAVLLRGGRAGEARPELEQELAIASATPGQGWAEAAALRGLLRVARETGEPAPPWQGERLAALERETLAAAAKDPHAAQALAGAYQWIEPAAAVTWLERTGAPDTFTEAFGRALFYQVAGKDAEARRALGARAPGEAWERACAAWMEARMSR